MKDSSEPNAVDIAVRTAPDQIDGRGTNGYLTPPVFAYGEDAFGGSPMYLRDYWNTIRKRLWLIIGVVLVVSAISSVKQARLPDIYSARARVQVDVESFSPALGASSQAGTYIDSTTYMDPEYFNTQVQILSSPTLMRRVARTLDLEHNRNFLNSPARARTTWQNLLRMFGFSTGNQSIPQSSGPVVQASESFLSPTAGSPDD